MFLQGLGVILIVTLMVQGYNILTILKVKCKIRQVIHRYNELRSLLDESNLHIRDYNPKDELSSYYLTKYEIAFKIAEIECCLTSSTEKLNLLLSLNSSIEDLKMEIKKLYARFDTDYIFSTPVPQTKQPTPAVVDFVVGKISRLTKSLKTESFPSIKKSKQKKVKSSSAVTYQLPNAG